MLQPNLTIQGLRGLLALIVVIYHAYRGLVTSDLIQAVPAGPVYGWIEHTGLVSVQLFFVISGYLILQSLSRRRDVATFVADRVLRIYPVFLVIHLLIFTAGPIIRYEWMADLNVGSYMLHFVSNLLLLPGLFPSLPEAQIVAWSLSYEFAFYLLTAAMFYTLTAKRLGASRPILFAACLLIAIVFVVKYPYALFFGVGIALLWFRDRDALERFQLDRWSFSLAGVGLLVLLYTTYGHVGLWVSLLLSLLLFVPILQQTGWLSRLLRVQAFQYLGRISYSLYLWHTFVMFPLKRIMPIAARQTDSEWLLFAVFAILSLALSIAVSHYSYEWIEQRLTKTLRPWVYRLIGSRRGKLDVPRASHGLQQAPEADTAR